MKNENSSTKRKYLLAFTVVTILNVGLGIFLLKTSFAQKTDKTYENQLSVVAEAIIQKDSPLRLTTINVDNSNTSYQVINFAVQNISGKPVRGYVVWAGNDDIGKIDTNFFPTKPFQPGVVYTEELFIERENIKSDTKIPLSIDYVEFEDGSSWGEDVQKQSEQIAGGRAGVEFAVDQIKNLFEKQETIVLDALLKNQLAEIEVPLPENIKSKSESWRNGFQGGYKSIVSFLKSHQEKEYNITIEELGKIKKNIQTERRQKQ